MPWSSTFVRCCQSGICFPRNIWTALRLDGTEGGSGLTHQEVGFCAGGIMPNQPNRKEKLCTNPTVYYGSYTDPQGRVRQKTGLPNCSTCGSSRDHRKVTYLIPIQQHIQVSTIPLLRCPHAVSVHGARLPLAHACAPLCCCCAPG